MKILAQELAQELGKDIKELSDMGICFFRMDFLDKKAKRTDFFCDVREVEKKIGAKVTHKSYMFIYDKEYPLFEFILQDGKWWISSLELVEHCQINRRASVWIYTKGVKKLGLIKNKDFIRIRHANNGGTTEYLVSIPAAIKMFVRVPNVKYVKENLEYNYYKLMDNSYIYKHCEQ